MRSLILKYLAAGCALIALATPADAQRRGGYYGSGYRGGYYGGGYAGYGGGWGYGRGWGYSTPYSSGYGYRYPSTSYYGYGNRYPSYGYSYPSYSHGYSDPSYNYSYPQYYSQQPQQTDITYHNYAQPQGTTSGYGDAATAQTWMKVIMPDPMARLTVQGQPTQQTGIEREFYSTPLERGRTYTYTLQAVWMENGREVTRERKVDIIAGQNTIVNLNDRTDPPQAMPAKGAIAAPSTGLAPLVGEIVRVEGEQVFFVDSKGGVERSFRLAPEGKLTIGGHRGEFNALKPGMRVTVTTQPNSTSIATSIEAVPQF